MANNGHIKVFVGSLPPGISEEVLRAYLSPYGPLTSIMLKAEQKYAFVFYPDSQTAQQAVQSMQGLPVEGSPIVAKIARPTNAGPAPSANGLHGIAPPPAAVRSHGGLGAARGPHSAPPGERVYIKGLPPGMTDDHLRHLFAGYGNVSDSKVLVSDGVYTDGTGQSVGIVRMASVSEAQWLVDNLNGNIPETLERPVDVSFAGARQPGGQPERASPYGPGAAGGHLQGQPGAPPPPNSAPPSWAAQQHQPPVSSGPMEGHPGAPPPPNSSPPAWASQQQRHAAPAMSGRSLGQFSAHPSVQSMKAQCAPNSKLYVKGLPRHADDAYLFKVFSPWGRIAEAVTVPKGDYCIGFVQYLTDEEAAEGISNVNSVPLLDGAILTVSVKAQK